MAEYKTKLENDTMEAVKLAFKECSTGIGFTLFCNIKIEKGEDTSVLTITPKEGKELRFSEIFRFGILIGRDFIDEKYCSHCHRRKKRILKKVYINKNSKKQ